MQKRHLKYVVPMLIVIVALLGGTYLLSRGVSARVEPSRLEVFVARSLRHFAIPRGARETRNPVTATPEVLAEAMEHFADHCAICHANDGRGNTSFGNGMYPKPPDMKTAVTQDLSDGELFYIIQNGVRFTGMPGFGSADGAHDADSWKLVHFIRNLPRMTPEEIDRMKEMNPKTPADLKEEDEINKFLEGNDTQEHHHH